VIETRKLSVKIDNRQILNNISIRIPKYSIFTIMGPSGSGKSTLLRVFNRLIELYPNVKIDGEVRLDGRDVFSMPAEEVRTKIQMVFQIPNPIPNLSIYENIALGPKLNKLVRSKRELDELVKSSLIKAQLWDEVKDRLKSPASSLSGGQQQRLCIARALAFKPEVMLMDEPTANLDPVNAAKIEELILELKREMTIVLVTHNPPQAARVSDYVTFLYNGEVVEQGSANEIFTKPRNELTEKYVTGRLY